MRRLAFLLLLIGTISAPVCVRAQDADSKPLVLDGFDTQGSITTGYRFTDVQGYRNQFTELFGLNSGFRVTDFSLFGHVEPGDNSKFADNYSLSVSGLGGDPYTTAQLTARKANLYDLRVNFQQTRFYWDQSNAPSENGLSSITNNQAFATVRKIGSIDLTIHATKNLRFNFEALRNTRDGVNFTTETLDYFGSSSTWGSFARANPYYLLAPMNESTTRITGGIDYTKNAWNFHYKIGYERFDDTVDGSNLVTNQRSINITDPTTARELLNSASFIDYRKLSTPISQFSYNGKITPNLEAHGEYIYYDYGGPAYLDMSANGIARTNSGGTTDAAYAFSAVSHATDSEPTNMLEQGFTYKLKEWWSVDAAYRYTRTDLNATGVYSSVTGTTLASGTSFNQWRIGTSQADLTMMFTPISSLLFDVGVRYLKSDVLALDNHVADPQETQRIKSVWPTLKVSYDPSKKFSIRGDIGETNNGTSYTRITPHTSIGGRVIVRYQPLEKLSIENATTIRNDKLLVSAYRSNVRGNATNISWAFTDRVQLFGGLSYESLFDTDVTQFLRGTAPLTDTITDRMIDRVWQGGVDLRPVRRLRVNFAGNYVRSTGLGQITGEAPLYGPVSFPYATGTIDYDVPYIGILGVRLQRTYYIEQIITANNFSAKLLTISWTHNF